MAITTCKHVEIVTHVLADVLGVEVENVEAGMLNAMAHQVYERLDLRSNASRNTVAQAIRRELLVVANTFGADYD